MPPTPDLRVNIGRGGKSQIIEDLLPERRQQWDGILGVKPAIDQKVKVMRFVAPGIVQVNVAVGPHRVQAGQIPDAIGIGEMRLGGGGPHIAKGGWPYRKIARNLE